MKKQLLYFALIALNIATIYAQPIITKTHTQIKSAIIASAVGDALGRVTEFIQSTDNIFKKYPHGINTFNDFAPNDWLNIPPFFKHNKIAPYTDDTAMTIIVIEELIQTMHNNYSMEQTMGNIARKFVITQPDQLGWAAPFRAPGISTKKAVHLLKQKIDENKTNVENWWAVGDKISGGCGSVMHAYPFGIIFANDLEKAAHWSAQHSLITHAHPWATASCAAMAVGMAQALDPARSPKQVTDSMITYAHTYDHSTALKIVDAIALAHEARKKLSHFESIELALANAEFRTFHEHVFTKYPGWKADDAIAATAYVFTLFPDDLKSALYTSVHTPGDSDSIASMVGALVGARDINTPLFFQYVENYDTLIECADTLYYSLKK